VAGGVPPGPPGADSEIALQLAIGREGIGLELARSARAACLTLTELSATLPGVRFPVDVSGGVQRFRHRRGELQKILLELPVRSLERWVSPRLRGVLSTRAPDVWVAAADARATVCVCAPESQTPVAAASKSAKDATGLAVVAFELHALAEDEDLVLVVEQARGGNLPAHSTAIALACLEAALGGVAERAGAVFVLHRAAHRLLQWLLPEAGARVPSTKDVRWAAVSAHGDTWLLHAARGALAHVPSERALSALETARLLSRADGALVRGEIAEARSAYLDALERAPRHPEIARRIVEIDARAGGRAEAALALLAETRAGRSGDASPSETDPFGTIPGELLAEVGDTAAALASLERAGDSDPAPWIAARAYETAASLARDPEGSAAWLDRALARAPRATTARWARVAKRLQLGRIEDALADVEHLEALARGGRARHAVWVRAGREWQAAGLQGRAGPLFERALRFAPEDPSALAGLGAALVQGGRATRGVAVLTRALRTAEGRGEPSSAIVLELAQAIADKLEDLPNAIARVGSISAEAAEAPMARGLEGRWRARLGDFAGADLAFARLREFATSLPDGADEPSADRIASMLLEAANLHRRVSHDYLAAQRYLAVALRLRPRDDELLCAYREVGAQLRGGAPQDPRSAAPPPRLAVPAASVAEDVPTESREARVEELTRRLQANARDDDASDELIALLEALERGHELVALVSARLEEASPERRALLAPRARTALQRLASKAEASGRADEASLFHDAIRLLVPG